MTEPIEGAWYDAEYFTGPTKSNYQPYGPGEWADWLADMIVEYLGPESVLDVGCAYGFVVQRLLRRGVFARGFDISEFAINQAHHLNQAELTHLTWVGDAADPAAYERIRRVDLVFSSEVGEHLTPDQVARFLALCRTRSDRMLLLVCTHDGEEEHPSAHGDESHINLRHRSWWVEQIEAAGWRIDDDERFNTDDRSKQMQWDGRFFVLSTKE